MKRKKTLKIIAGVMIATAVGSSPLMGVSDKQEQEQQNMEQNLGNGIMDIIYNKEYLQGINIPDTQLVNAIIVQSSNNEPNIIKECYLSGQNGFKSYMPYNCITDSASNQYALQNIAYTGDYGIRMVDGRYCVAIGTALSADVGTYIDIVLENETIIPCIVGDIKDNKHTLQDNLTTAANGCVSEFIVDNNNLIYNIRSSGNISSANQLWNSPVNKFIVYDYNVLKKE